MIRVGIICIAAVCGVLAFINGLYMLVSPRAWFRLPGWMRASGPLAKKDYSTGWGALQIRFLGLLILGFFLGVGGSILFDEFVRHR
jgi:ABC-type uncharacterized transport system permease subunit